MTRQRLPLFQAKFSVYLQSFHGVRQFVWSKIISAGGCLHPSSLIPPETPLFFPPWNGGNIESFPRSMGEVRWGDATRPLRSSDNISTETGREKKGTACCAPTRTRFRPGGEDLPGSADTMFQAMLTPSSRYSRSLLRKVRMEIPRASAVLVRLLSLNCSERKMAAFSISRSVAAALSSLGRTTD